MQPAELPPRYTANPFATRDPGHFAVLDATSEHYHLHCDGVSRSMLEDAIDDPALFHGYYVAKTYERPAPTAEMRFGTLVHAVLLENALDETIVEIPASALNGDGHRKGAGWTSFLRDLPLHAEAMKREEIAPLREIRRRVEEHKVARKLLLESVGTNEYTFEWRDDSTGLLLKTRLDRWCEFGPSQVIVDVKTTARVDPKSFAETCWRWGYHRQAAFYRAGVEAMEGERLPFVFVAIRKTPPYSVACYDLEEASGDFLALGEQQINEAMADLARRRDCGDWSATTGDHILTLSAPRWAKYQEEYSV